MNNWEEMRRGLEAVLFVADEPVPTNDLAVLFERPTADIEIALVEMAEDFEHAGRGVVIRQVGGGWRMATHPAASAYLERFVSTGRGARLSQASLETLAIVAYRQPIARTQLAEIRGVASDGVLRTLISRGVVEEVGKDPGLGQASLFGTTPLFLEKLGLNSLSELPPLADLMPDSAAVERMESGLGPGL